MTLFLLLILVAVALGIVSTAVNGMLYLLAIGVVVFLCAFVVLGARLRRRRPPAR